MKETYNKPYLWHCPGNYPNSAILDYKRRERKTRSFTFMYGHPLPFDTGNSNLYFTLQDPKKYDLIFHAEVPMEKLLKFDTLPNNCSGRPPIVNQRVLDLLTKHCPNDFQAFPVTICNENPKLPDFENHDYFLLNLTNLVDAIDFKESKLTWDDDGDIDDLKTLRLKSNSMKSHHLARLKLYKIKVLVSPELVELFKKEKIKGVQFLKDEEAYFW